MTLAAIADNPDGFTFKKADIAILFVVTLCHLFRSSSFHFDFREFRPHNRTWLSRRAGPVRASIIYKLQFPFRLSRISPAQRSLAQPLSRPCAGFHYLQAPVSISTFENFARTTEPGSAAEPALCGLPLFTSSSFHFDFREFRPHKRSRAQPLSRPCAGFHYLQAPVSISTFENFARTTEPGSAAEPALC